MPTWLMSPRTGFAVVRRMPQSRASTSYSPVFTAREKFLQPVMAAPATVPGSAKSCFVGLSVCMEPASMSAIVEQRS